MTAQAQLPCSTIMNPDDDSTIAEVELDAWPVRKDTCDATNSGPRGELHQIATVTPSSLLLIDAMDSTKCTATGSLCAYPTPALSQQEEKWCHMNKPGLTVWRVGTNKLDPFEALPIQMPFRSQELLHYCTKACMILTSGTVFEHLY